MKRNLRLKRFIISLVILLISVFALYPYLSHDPQRRLIKSVAGLEKAQAASVIRTVLLGDALIEKVRDLSLDGEQSEAAVALLEKLGGSVETLKKELTAMPPHSKQLSPAAEQAYKSLDNELTAFILTLFSEGGK